MAVCPCVRSCKEHLVLPLLPAGPAALCSPPAGQPVAGAGSQRPGSPPVAGCPARAAASNSSRPCRCCPGGGAGSGPDRRRRLLCGAACLPGAGPRPAGAVGGTGRRSPGLAARPQRTHSCGGPCRWALWWHRGWRCVLKAPFPPPPVSEGEGWVNMLSAPAPSPCRRVCCCRQSVACNAHVLGLPFKRGMCTCFHV